MQKKISFSATFKRLAAIAPDRASGGRLFLSQALLLAFLLPACAKPQDQITDRAYQEGVSLLNQRDFAGALGKFDEAQNNHPGNQEIQRKRIDALAGLGGFEAVPFKREMEGLVALSKSGMPLPKEKKIETNAEAVHPSLLTNFDEGFSGFAGRMDFYTRTMPILNRAQIESLDQAVDAIKAMGPAASLTSEENFRWGTLRVFRGVKRTRGFAVQLQKLNLGCSDTGAAKELLDATFRILDDSLGALENFHFSYKKPRDLVQGLANLLQKSTNGKISLDSLPTGEGREAMLQRIYASNLQPLNEALALMLFRNQFRSQADCKAFEATGGSVMQEQFKRDRATAAVSVSLQGGADDDGGFQSAGFFQAVAEAQAVPSNQSPTDVLQENEQEQRLAEIVTSLADQIKAEEIPPRARSSVEKSRGMVDAIQLQLAKDRVENLRQRYQELGIPLDPSIEGFEAYTAKQLESH